MTWPKAVALSIAMWVVIAAWIGGTVWCICNDYTNTGAALFMAPVVAIGIFGVAETLRR